MIVAPPVSVPSSSILNEKKKNELFPKCLRTKQVAYPCKLPCIHLDATRWYLSVSNLKTSHSVLDYHELKRLQGISDGSDHRSVPQEVDGESLKVIRVLQRRSTSDVYEAICIRIEASTDKKLDITVERRLLSSIPIKLNRALLFHRSKSTRTETTDEPAGLVGTQPFSSATPQILSRRSRKTVTPLQRSIQLLRRHLRKL